MKLGIAYNIFDGEEMLPFTLKNQREFADFMVVVYQQKSNFGNENPNLLPLLNKLKGEGLIDKLVEYEPIILLDDKGETDWKNGTLNEQKKRQIGLDECRAAGCDTFMTLDCDELYDKEEFKWAMDEFERGGYDTSFTNLLTYYKKPTLQLSPPETWFQPLFYKIKKGTKFEFLNRDDYPVFTDTTKMVKAGHIKVFARNEIQQYHYAYVRHNLNSKTLNSSARTNDMARNCVNAHYNMWKEGDFALLIGMQRFELIEVENKFNIQL